MPLPAPRRPSPLASPWCLPDRWWRSAPRSAPALIALLIALALAACTDRTEPLGEAPPVTFRTLDGRNLVLAEATGPVLVNFWATDCVVCLKEIPDLVALHADYAPKGFELVAVAMPHDPPNAVLELAEARELPYPVAIDIDGAVLAAFEPVPGTPTSFLIDAEGQVIERHVGALDVAALRGRLDELLGREGDDLALRDLSRVPAGSGAAASRRAPAPRS